MHRGLRRCSNLSGLDPAFYLSTIAVINKLQQAIKLHWTFVGLQYSACGLQDYWCTRPASAAERNFRTAEILVSFQRSQICCCGRAVRQATTMSETGVTLDASSEDVTLCQVFENPQQINSDLTTQTVQVEEFSYSQGDGPESISRKVSSRTYCCLSTLWVGGIT